MIGVSDPYRHYMRDLLDELGYVGSVELVDDFDDFYSPKLEFQMVVDACLMDYPAASRGPIYPSPSSSRTGELERLIWHLIMATDVSHVNRLVMNETRRRVLPEMALDIGTQTPIPSS
jgi:hypothetical protein